MIWMYSPGVGVVVGDAVVVDHQLRVREVLLRQPEGVEDPVPPRAVGPVGPTERPRVVAAGAAAVALIEGRRAVGRVVQRLVDDLEPLDVGIARRDAREPLVDLHQLLLSGQRRHPRRLLVAPDQHVEIEREVVGLGEGVDRVEVRPAHGRGSRRTGCAPPLARVLRRHLVEVLGEQGAGELVHAPKPLVLAVDREPGAGLRRRRGRSEQGARQRRDRDDRAGPMGPVHSLSASQLVDGNRRSKTLEVGPPNEP